MAKKKEPLDPQMQALVDQALASGDPLGFINELSRQLQDDPDADIFGDNPEIELPDPPLHPTLLTVRVDIADAHPPIWRRLELRGDLTLDEVHDHLQAAFGWLDGHLHRFDAPGGSGRRTAYFITDFDAEEGGTGTFESEARLDQVLRETGERLRYTYDFGDNWRHTLKVEAVRPATDDDPPAQCTGGRGACPPEDVGGIHTWNDLAAALRDDPDPAHLTGDLAMYADWLPRDCDPDDFPVESANESISFAGKDIEELLHDGTGPQGAPSSLLPQPRAQLAQTLSRCTTQEAVDNIGRIAARAHDIEEDVTADDLRAALHPWQVVLDVIDGGVQLSSAGWMPPAAVEQIWHESGVAWDYGKGNREQHTPEVAALRQDCLRAGLLRKHKGRLLPTKRGTQARTSPDTLLAAIADALIDDKDDFIQDARVISLLFIAAHWQLGPDSRWAAHAAQRGTALRPWELDQAFWDDVAHMLTDIGWRVDDTVPINRDHLGYDAHAAMRMLTTGDEHPIRLPDSAVARRIARAALFE